MSFVTLLVFGWVALDRLPLNLLPDISYPRVTIRAEYPGAAPEDVEERVTRRLHETLSVLPGLQSISSISRAELVDVTLEFGWKTNLSFAIQDIRERLDRTQLPLEVPIPIILRFDPRLDPVMVIGLTGGRDLSSLRSLAEDRLATSLSTSPGVAAVRVRGGLEEEIQIRLQPGGLVSRGLRPSDIISRLAAENVNLPSGTVLESDTEYLVRILNEYQTPEEIGRTTLPVGDGTEVRLEEIAEIKRTPKERDVITRINGKESVLLYVYKEADANLVEMATTVRTNLFGTEAQRQYVAQLLEGQIEDPDQRYEAFLARVDSSPKERAAMERLRLQRPWEGGMGQDGFSMSENSREEDTRSREEIDLDEKLKAEERELLAAIDAKERAFRYDAALLPSDIEVHLLSDQSRFIRQALEQVRQAGVVGAVLAVIVLFLFLRRLSSTLIVGVAIPISVAVTFVPLHLSETTLNVMSLGGLALGIGMVVDNAIVVLESIARMREQGQNLRQAAVSGVSEVAGAVTASTLTTVAVFAPIVFVEGIAGQIFRDQALTVVASLFVSLVVALFLVPMLAGQVEKNSDKSLSDKDWARSWKRTLHLARSALVARAQWKADRGSMAKRTKGARFLLFPFFLILRLYQLALELVGRLSLIAFGIAINLAGLAMAGAALVFLGVMKFPARVFSGAFEILHQKYPPFIRAIISSPSRSSSTLVLAAVLLILTVRLGQSLGGELLPEVHQGEIVGQLTMPVGTPLETTDRVARQAEDALEGLDGVSWFASTIGVPRDEVSPADEGEHTAKISIGLRTGSEDMGDLEETVKTHLREALASLPELRDTRFESPALFTIRSPIQVEIKGEDLASINATATEVAGILTTIEGLEDITNSVQPGSPEILLSFDRDLLSRLGLDTRQVASLVADSVKGNVATRFNDYEHKLDVLVLTDKASLQSIDDLLDLPANPSGEGSEPLSSLAQSHVREGPREIRRIWGQRAAVVSASLSGFDIGRATAEIDQRIQHVRQSSDLNITLGGQGEQMEGALSQMTRALLLAVFLVFVVMASIFESLLQPLVILVTIPLALFGAILALYLFDIPLSVVVFIGGIILAGIVVNNAIVLIDAINRRRHREGHGLVDAVTLACEMRLRPILMTTLTTILGLLPLTGWLPGTGGEGTELRAPMAITVVAGLATATLLTLIVIPTVYVMVERRSEFRQKTS